MNFKFASTNSKNDITFKTTRVKTKSINIIIFFSLFLKTNPTTKTNTHTHLIHHQWCSNAF